MLRLATRVARKTPKEVMLYHIRKNGCSFNRKLILQGWELDTRCATECDPFGWICCFAPSRSNADTGNLEHALTITLSSPTHTLGSRLRANAQQNVELVICRFKLA